MGGWDFSLKIIGMDEGGVWDRLGEERVSDVIEEDLGGIAVIGSFDSTGADCEVEGSIDGEFPSVGPDRDSRLP